MSQNPNQLTQLPLRGQIDLSVNDGGLIMGILGAVSGGGTLKPGDRVKIDATSTGKFPKFIAAAVGEEAFGTICRDIRQSAYAEGARIRVATHHLGHAQFHTAFAEIVPGAEVEMKADGTIQTKASNNKTGIALDYFAAGATARILVENA